MSSIDKYVRSCAQQYDSRVTVRKFGDRLCGYIKGRKIFDLADRYGYLSDSESAEIRNSIDEYRDMERALEEARRLEAEERRKSAIANARDLYAAKMNEIERSLSRSLEAVKNARGVFFTAYAKFGKIKGGISLEPVRNLAADVEASLAGTEKNAAAAKSAALADLAACAVKDSATTEAANRSATAIRKIKVRSVSTAVIAAAKSAADKLNQIFPVIVEINALAADLRSVKTGTDAADMVIRDALAEIDRTDASDVSRLLALKESLTRSFDRFREIIEKAENAERAAELAALEASFVSFRQRTETFAGTGNYGVHSYGEEIGKTAEDIAVILKEMEKFEYVGISEKKLAELKETAEDIVFGNAADEVSHRKIDDCKRRLAEILSRAQAARGAYAEYKERAARIASFGAEPEEIPVFRENDTAGLFGEMERIESECRIRAEESLMLEKNIELERIMSECGFKLFKREQSRAAYIEEVFVCEGFPDVAYQALILPNGSISLGITGVLRRDKNLQTTVSHVVESAKRFRETGVTAMIAQKFQETGGVITAALDDDDDFEKVKNSLNATGYIYLDREGEALFDEATKPRETRQSAAAAVGTQSSQIYNPEVTCEKVSESNRKNSTDYKKNALRNLQNASYNAAH